MWKNDQAAHRPHTQQRLSQTVSPGPRPPWCPLQPPTNSNYFNTKHSVCKKSVYSYPAEMKIYFPEHAISILWGNKWGILGEAFCVNSQGLLCSDAFHGVAITEATSMSLGYFLDTTVKPFFPSVSFSKWPIFIVLVQKTWKDTYGRDGLNGLGKRSTEMFPTPNCCYTTFIWSHINLACQAGIWKHGVD